MINRLKISLWTVIPILFNLRKGPRTHAHDLTLTISLNEMLQDMFNQVPHLNYKTEN